MIQQTSTLRRQTTQPIVTSLFNGVRAIGSVAFTELFVTRPAFLPHETDDTLLTGGTRSLNRRLLALNVEGTLRRRPTGAHQLEGDLSLLSRSA